MKKPFPPWRRACILTARGNVGSKCIQPTLVLHASAIDFFPFLSLPIINIYFYSRHARCSLLKAGYGSFARRDFAVTRCRLHSSNRYFNDCLVIMATLRSAALLLFAAVREKIYFDNISSDSYHFIPRLCLQLPLIFQTCKKDNRLLSQLRYRANGYTWVATREFRPLELIPNSCSQSPAMAGHALWRAPVTPITLA